MNRGREGAREDYETEGVRRNKKKMILQEIKKEKRIKKCKSIMSDVRVQES